MLTLFSGKSNQVGKKHIVFTAPSGAGKTTIVRHLLKEFDELDFSVSATTREKRAHETDGKDYYFLTPHHFKTKISNGEFVEYEEVYTDQFYGTLFSEIERIEKLGKSIVFDIDVEGAVSIKNAFADKVMTVFIKPPSFEILKQRLIDRNTESEASLKKRLKRVEKEMTFESKFDQTLVNDLLEVALEEAEIIVRNFLDLDS